MSHMLNIFVYGGCVSRDAAGRARESTITSYVARQSLLSAMSNPTPVPKSVGNLESPFQRRAVEGDYKSSLRAQVRRHAEDTNLFYMDILVERFGVHPLEGKQFVTRSAEFKRAGLDKTTPGLGKHIAFGTERHLGMWKRAATRFDIMVSRLELKGRIIVLELPWAQRTIEGTETKPSAGMTAAEANAAFAPYYEHLRSLDFPILSIPGELTLATTGHKWNEEPFHYADPTYDWIAEQTKQRLT